MAPQGTGSGPRSEAPGRPSVQQDCSPSLLCCSLKAALESDLPMPGRTLGLQTLEEGAPVVRDGEHKAGGGARQDGGGLPCPGGSPLGAALLGAAISLATRLAGLSGGREPPKCPTLRADPGHKASV